MWIGRGKPSCAPQCSNLEGFAGTRDPIGPDCFLVATEACGGGTPDLGYFLEVWVFIGVFGVGLMSRGSPSRPRARGRAQGVGLALHPRGWLGTLLAQLFYSWGFFWSIKNHRGGFIPFGIPFLRNLK